MAQENPELTGEEQPARAPLAGIALTETAPRAVGLSVRMERRKAEGERRSRDHGGDDEITVLLRPSEPFGSAQSEGQAATWHYVQPPPGMTVTLVSSSEHMRRVCLTVRCAEPGWKHAWARWSYAIRKTPDIQGGETLGAQDQLSEDETALTFLLLPGETRRAGLEFVMTLDGETRAGNYSFELVASDTDTGEEALTYGMLRLRHPDVGLLSYLPSLFREACGERESPYSVYMERSFFERFLRGFEDCIAPMQERIANLYRLFDADTAPADLLPWLATWVSLALNENWPELKRRRLIQEAVELYRWRGTRRGLSRYLEIYTGVIPEINDRPYEGMRLGGAALLGSSAVLGGVAPHTFSVTIALPPGVEVSERIARAIIESEKPAHAAYELAIVRRTEN